MKLKPYIKTLHLWLGLVSGLVVFVVALSGSVLVFEDELGPFFDPAYYNTPEHAAAAKIPMDILIENALQKHPGAVLQNLYTFNDPKRSVLINLTDINGEQRVISASPYSGKILKDTLYEKRFFTIVTKLHRYLLMGDTGKAITGAVCLIFTALLISGMILWWPSKLKNLKQRLKIKWKASFKRVNWDIHAVLGFYSVIPLLLIALTGLIWSYRWYENTMYYIADGTPKPIHKVKNRETDSYSTRDNNNFYTSILKETDSLFTYRGDIRLIRDLKGKNSILVLKENLEAPIPNIRDMVYFDMYSGERLQIKRYDELSAGDKIRRMIYPLHTGSIYGYPTKILAFVVCLIAAASPVTGLLIWTGRKKKKNKAFLRQKAESHKPRKLRRSIPERQSV